MECAAETNQEFPVFLLSVKILKASNIASTIALCPSECYVTLHLPTASYNKYRTRSVMNFGKNPVWNETFYFRVQTEIKNILELAVCDANPICNDDVEFIILFDLAKIQPGSTAIELFSIKPKDEQRCHYESLEVEFRLAETPGPFECLTSNSVLVAREISILDVKVDKEDNEKLLQAKKNIVFTVQESYEGTQITTNDLDSFRFHCIKGWGPVLKAKLQEISDQEENTSDNALILPLDLLPVGPRVKVGLPLMEGGALELHLQLISWSQNLDVRLEYDLCEEEQGFLLKRKMIVADAFKQLFHLRRDLLEHEAPVVAVMATGGGVRAMTALYGHLFALQKLNLLDCVTYMTTSSGSTWTLTNLYQDTDWSHTTLEKPIKEAKSKMMKSKLNVISVERLKYYHKELTKRFEEGHLPSFTALWALVQEAFLNDQPNYSKLSEQRLALNQGQNPLPMYTAINVKDKHVSTFDFREWVEFSPYEVGFQKYGAYIRAEDYDSEFFMGKLVKKIPESRISFLEGVWTNIISMNLLDGLYWSTTPEEFWDRWTKDMIHKNENINSEDGYTTVYKPPHSVHGKLCEIFNDILTDRPLKGATHNFLQGLEFNQDYFNQENFLEWKDTVLDDCPNKLTPAEKSLCLTDIGFFLNNSGPPLLRPERKVDVIIALDYVLGELFTEIELLAKYCHIQGIPFPKINPSKEERENPKECYVFKDEDNPQAPMLLYFPLVNASFKKFTAPGVKRTPSEMKGGDISLDKDTSPYRTMHFTYSEEDFDKLLNLATYNILSSKDLILQTLQDSLQKKLNVWSMNTSSA